MNNLFYFLPFIIIISISIVFVTVTIVSVIVVALIGLVMEEGKNIRYNNVNHQYRINATSHLHVRSEKVDVPINLLHKFLFPDGKLQQSRIFVGGKLGINGTKMSIQPLGGNGRNALKNSVNVGLQYC